MHAMIVDLDAGRLERSQIAFLETGIHVTGSGSLAVAETCLRRAVVDVLVLDADCGAQHIAELTALAERRNPRLVTLMLARDVGAATDFYSDAIGSLHCVLDGLVAPRMVARMAQASLAGRAACKMTPVRADQEPLAPRPVFQTTRRKPAAPAAEAVLA
ncbi:hypothetical protein [Maliponia aquimaris]|uniref:Response regulatory domain-containing protein n=1 Tax=Maliponia aquimaris TaxID=1673631 RepID=A0A238L3W7_9RHOB|nr:hypothetical protein [Maliponia aquimaris]SMX49550.1 hypothetical protein MAA8898_04339 [Maliponia aquimaris]